MLALGEPMISRSPLANVLLRDGDWVPGTHKLIAVPARLVRHVRGLTLRLPPGHGLLAEVLARLRAVPNMP
jgi:hypothetical protein